MNNITLLTELSSLNGVRFSMETTNNVCKKKDNRGTYCAPLDFVSVNVEGPVDIKRVRKLIANTVNQLTIEDISERQENGSNLFSAMT